MKDDEFQAFERLTNKTKRHYRTLDVDQITPVIGA